MLKTKHVLPHKYRTDIDGLRAVAVLAVVAFHAFPSWLKGGFTGVDIFFVISGFLISKIILESLEAGTFSFRMFYSARIRRIFPALIIVLTVSYMFGWFTLLTDEYKQLGKHIAGGAAFLSNLLLWNEAGYFDNASETKALLHLWSLGVEVQFYIFFPLMLWIVWNRRINLIAIVLTTALMSFLLNLRGINIDPIGTFYSPLTRFWEFIFGGILAWVLFYKIEWLQSIKDRLDRLPTHTLHRKPIKFDGETLSNFTSIFGLTLLFFGFLRIEKEFGFPGGWALVPVLGTALIILAGPQAWVNRKILSNRVSVWFGLISFPLYLWHWVLLSFPRIIQGEFPNRTTRIIAVLLSIILSWLTYRFIERPFRFGGFGKIKTAVLLWVLIIIGLIGYGTFLAGGLDFRKDAHLYNSRGGDTGHIEFHKHIAEKYFLCKPKNISDKALKWGGYIRCMQSKQSDQIDIAIVGDSHAEHLFIGMAEALPNKNIVFYIKDNPPFVDNEDFKDIYESVVKNNSIKTVILTMYWTGRISQTPKESTLDKEIFKVVDDMLKSGKVVILTDDVPVFPFDPEKCKGSRRIMSSNVCNIGWSTALSQTDVYLDSLIKVVESRPSVRLLSIGKYLCGEEGCSMAKDEYLLYRDRHHLNIIGSTFVGQRLVEDNLELFK